MGLEDLMDGAMCTAVYVRAPLDEVHALSDRLATRAEGDQPRVIVALMADSDWVRIELSAITEDSRLRDDSDPLIWDALIALRDQPGADTPPTTDRPVSFAWALSRQLGCEAVAVWASDQGPGIGGAVVYDAGGKRRWVLSAGTVDDLRALDALRDNDDERADAVLEAIEARAERQTVAMGMPTPSMKGHVAIHVDRHLKRLGIDPDWADEPLWTLQKQPKQEHIARYVILE